MGDDGSTLVIQLRAPWVARRSYSSCWLSLPPLSGAQSHQETTASGVDPDGGGRRLQVALTAAERKVLGSDEPLLATTYIRPLGGAVDAGSSIPSPRSNGRTWSYSCRGRLFVPLTAAQVNQRLRGGGSDEGRGALLLRGLDGLPTGDGFSEDTYTKRLFDENDCGATAVINDVARGSRRDLFVLLLGTMLGLAGALVVESVVVALRLRAEDGAGT